MSNWRGGVWRVTSNAPPTGGLPRPTRPGHELSRGALPAAGKRQAGGGWPRHVTPASCAHWLAHLLVAGRSASERLVRGSALFDTVTLLSDIADVIAALVDQVAVLIFHLWSRRR